MATFKCKSFDILPQTAPNLKRNSDGKTRDNAADDSGKSIMTSLVYTILSLVCNVSFRVATAWYVRKTKLHLFFAWTQSFIVLIYFWKRRRSGSVNSLKSSPGVYLYIVFVIINETSSNQLTSNGTGSEVIQLGLATCPLFLVLTILWSRRKTQPSFVMAFVAAISLIMTVTVCSIDEPYFPFRINISNGLTGMTYGLITALMILSFQQQLIDDQMSIFQLMYSLNLVCVVSFPFGMLMTGEVNQFLAKGIPGSIFHLLIVTFFLACLRALDQASCLYQIKYTSSLVHNATRSLAWIPVSLVAVFTLKLELMIPSFVCFLLNILFFMAVMSDHLANMSTL